MSKGEDVKTQRARRTRTDERDEPAVQLGYQDPEGETVAATGDEDSVYTGPLGKASSDGTTGLNPQEDGETQRFALDTYGHLYVRAISPSPETAPSRYTSTAAESSRVIKGSAGIVFRIAMLVSAGLAADVVLMVFDKTSAPQAGDVPIWRALLNAPGPAIGEVSDGFDPDKPLACVTGISIGVSTTLGTFTSAGNIGFFEVLYD